MKAYGLAIAAAAVIATSASADNWSMTFVDYGLHKLVKAHYNAEAAYDGETATSFGTIKAGQHIFTAFGNTFSNYCAQLFEPLPAKGTSAVWCTAALEDIPDAPPAPGPMKEIKAALVQDLYARFHAAVQDSNDACQTAAFQVVVWELTHENFDADTATEALGQISLTLGAFQISATNADVMTAANSMIDALGDGGFLSLGDNLFGLTNEIYQDHLVVVPIPAPVLLAGVGLLGAVALRRRVK